ncbi:MAG: excinuclease ABC subunit UvrC [Thermodesulfobacteriota bacterium]|nr:excinuclease ABC subunit UvrC [Thermodesulfobacteriota bacterium]
MKNYPITSEFLSSVPHQSGVYIMKDDAGRTLYVGKAGDLRKRLASYSRSDVQRSGKTVVMLKKVSRIETILTGTEKEALILEASLIKRHSPRYNITLRDDKNYPSIKVTVKEEWPRVLMSRRRVRDGSRYFGPYSSSSAMKETLNYLNTLFPLRQCKGKNIRQRKRPCLNFQMDRCPAPCTGRADRRKYLDRVKGVLMALEGRNRELIRELESGMKKASDDLNFEEAALLRDRIKAIRDTLEKQSMVAPHFKDQDAFGFFKKGTAVSVFVLFVRNGIVSGQRSFFFPDPVGEDSEILAQVVERYYGNENYVPHEVLVSQIISGKDLVSEWLCDLKGSRVSLRFPERGLGLKLIRMAEINAGQLLEEREKKAESWKALSRAVKKQLKLAREPFWIECLDISNIGGDAAVGSLVSFSDGKEDKKNYRHYRIRSVSGPDDYAMMYEVLARRFKRALEEKTFPDLLMVDGGKGQLNTALSVFSEMGFVGKLDVAAIAKEGAGVGEKLYRPGRKNPILLKNYDPVLLFLMRIRDESHRYGITFHRRLRRKQVMKSKLDLIPGVGPARKNALLKSLGSLKKIEQASIDELVSVNGIGHELAVQIHSFLVNVHHK